MQVARWGNDLAVRLPSVVVEALALQEGDDIEIVVDDARRFAVRRKPGQEQLLTQLRSLVDAGGTLYSEDMHHGLVLEATTTIRKPFAG